MSVSEIFGDLPELETARLRLVKAGPQFAWDLFQFASDPEATRYMTWATSTQLEQVDQVISYLMALYEEGEVAPWLIQEKATLQVIGMTGFNWWNPRHARAEISYALARPFWGQGFATEAVVAVLHFGFTQMELHRVEALVHPANLPSRRLLERLGMTLEGTLREAVSLRGVPTDHAMYSLLRKEWEDAQHVR